MASNKPILYLIMDVSGSVNTALREKFAAINFAYAEEIAYEFKQQPEVVPIRYTTFAEISKNLQEFYYDKRTGGTIASSGLKAARDHMRKVDRNRPIFVSFCNDGDTWNEDDVTCGVVLNEIHEYASGIILPSIQNVNGYGQVSEGNLLKNVLHPFSERKSRVELYDFKRDESVASAIYAVATSGINRAVYRPAIKPLEIDAPAAIAPNFVLTYTFDAPDVLFGMEYSLSHYTDLEPTKALPAVVTE